MDERELGHTPCNWEQSERLLARTFESWRAEFRTILEDHRREIQARLEKIEREIEKKSDKENVDLLVRNIQDDLRRHATTSRICRPESTRRWASRRCGKSWDLCSLSVGPWAVLSAF